MANVINVIVELFWFRYFFELLLPGYALQINMKIVGFSGSGIID